MKNTAFKTVLAVCLISTSLTACVPNISANNYDVQSSGQAQTVRYGVIIEAHAVQVNGNNGVGTLTGALAGGIAGSAIGGGTRMNSLGAVGGAVLGGIAGKAIESKLSDQQGMQYIVQLDNGRSISVVQGPDTIFAAGQRVIILSGTNARDRIVADTGYATRSKRMKAATMSSDEISGDRDSISFVSHKRAAQSQEWMGDDN